MDKQQQTGHPGSEIAPPVTWGRPCDYCTRYQRPCGRHDIPSSITALTPHQRELAVIEARVWLTDRDMQGADAMEEGVWAAVGEQYDAGVRGFLADTCGAWRRT